MSLDTNLNTSPYNDDYDPEKNYHRVLFRPSIPVQARELTQLQSILQNQIERFGNHVFRDGTIVEGCTISFDSKLNYVKLKDTYANNVFITVSDLINKTVTNRNGLTALIVNTADGYEVNYNNNGANSDLNTIYVKYTSTGQYANSAYQKVFDADDVLDIYDDANNVTGSITVANTATVPTGYGYGINITDGIIFQKGFFIRVDTQSAIVSRYTNEPDSLSVGFNTNELIVTPEADNTLYDNAQGSPNQSAPGAHRLKLTANLIVRTTSTSNTDTFFAIAEFNEGAPSVINQDTSYSDLGRNLARMRYEESGNYVISPFNINVEANTSNLSLVVSAGVGYVDGYRVELHDKIRTNLRPGDTVVQANAQIISANFGNYVNIDNIVGNFDFTKVASVEFWGLNSAKWWNNVRTINDASTALANTSNKIANAFVKSNVYAADSTYTDSVNDSSPTYRLYLINLQTIANKNFKNADTVVYRNADNSIAAIASIKNNANTSTELKDSNNSRLLFPFGQRSIKTLRTELTGNNTATTFRFRTSANVTLIQGTSNVSFVSTNALPYSGLLSTATKGEFSVITTNDTTVPLAGTVTSTGANVVGTGTNFALVKVGDILTTNAGAQAMVTTVANSTYLTTATNLNASGAVISRLVPSGSIIPLTTTLARSVTVSGNTVTLGFDQTTDSFSNNVGLVVQYNAVRSNALPISKNVNRSRFVKIQCSNNTNTTIGPWSLGVPDVFKLRSVYVGTGNTFVTTTTNQVDSFVLDSGQRDDYYGISTISLNPSSVLRLTANSNLLVEFDYFTNSTTQGVGFFTVDSYPVSNLASNTTITREEIPFYTNDSGISFDLRDSVDFRPVVVATTTVTADANTAPVNPTTGNSFQYTGQQSYIVANDSQFQTNVQYYLGRKDKLVITPQARLQIIEGVPDTNPKEPSNISGAMTLATIDVPPLPTLTYQAAQAADRLEHAVTVTPQQNRRYTMQDIGTLSQRIGRLEYYTSLSLLESSAQSLLVRSSETGSDRFKNGFLVDPFDNHSIGNTLDSTYNIAIDSGKSEARPAFKLHNIDLELDSNNSVSVHKDDNVVTIDYAQETQYIAQPFASKFRNCVENIVYVFKGVMKLTPDSDTATDVTYAPTITNYIDIASGIASLADAFGTQWGDWRDTSVSSSSSSSSTSVTAYHASATGHALEITSTDTTVTTATSQLRTGTSINVDSTTNSYNFGDFVTSVSVQPFVRPNVVLFSVQGLKPNTRVYPFFDDKPVSQYCVQAFSSDYNSHCTLALQSLGYIPTSSALISDIHGNLFGYFLIPAGVFNTGNVIFKVVDVDDLVTGTDAITTSASATYVASNLSVVKATSELQTREPVVSTSTVSDSRTIVTQNTSNALSAVDLGVDPIGQTFFVNEPAGGVDGVYITKLDLYFQKKSATLGVEVQIREVENGSPTPKILPFASKVLSSNDVSTSNDASAATTVVFDSPVFVKNNQEYFICVLPIASNPDYNIWIGEVGGTDITTNAPIWTNNSTGVLFTSSTNRVWTPLQKEDLKVRIYAANFASGGVATFKNKPLEYFDINSIRGTFNINERVYMTGPVIENATVNNSNTITVANSIVYNINESVFAINNGVPFISRITGRPSNTTITLANNVPVSGSIAFGKLRGSSSAPLTAIVSEIRNEYITATDTTATASVNFSNPTGSTLIIGETSGAFANCYSLGTRRYNAVVPRISSVAPVGTNITWNYRGVVQSNNAIDVNTISVVPNNDNELTDQPRVILSYSDELTKLNANSSLRVTATFSSANSKITPIVDKVKLYSTVTENRIVPGNQLRGQILFTTDSGISFSTGDVVTQGSNSALVVKANTSFVRVMNVNGAVLGTGTVSNGTANVNVESVRSYSEESGTVYSPSRYVSKSVILAEKQDAEDLVVLVTAYRPVGTDIKVYCKLLSGQDSDSFDSKDWTLMSRSTSNSVTSSLTQPNDFVELQYQLPRATTLLTNQTITANQVGFNISTAVNPGEYVCISANNNMVVSKVIAVNNNTITVDQPLGINSSNASVSVIKGLSSPQGAFSYDGNSGVVRYVTKSRAIFDTYKIFAIKLVPVSNTTSIVPRMADMRAIALQI